MFRCIHFAVSLLVAALAASSMASGQPLTSDECREMGKALSKIAPSADTLENALPNLDRALKDKLLPRASDQLRASAVSAIQANQELLATVRKFQISMEALVNRLQLCADANSTGVNSSDAGTPPTTPVAPKDDGLKSDTASVSQSPVARAPAATIETPSIRSNTANQEAAKPPLAAPLSPYDSWESRQLCEAAIKKAATHPSTVDIWGFTGYATVVRSNSDRAIKQTFTAKNAFGLELKYDAYCIISPDGKLDSFSVNERR